jgi:hypothetical protein
MRKVLGLAAVGLIAAVVTLAAPSTSEARVVVTPNRTVATKSVGYRAYRSHHRGHRARNHRRGYRSGGRYHRSRYHHGRYWRR